MKMGVFSKTGRARKEKYSVSGFYRPPVCGMAVG